MKHVVDVNCLRYNDISDDHTTILEIDSSRTFWNLIQFGFWLIRRFPVGILILKIK